MSVRKTRRYTFESLERRDTPSAGLHSAIVHHVSRPARPIAFRGSATIGLTGPSTGAVTNGQSNLGPFTGTIDGTNVTLTSPNGTLNLVVAFKVGAPRGGRETLRGTFRIVSGNIGDTPVVGGQGTLNGVLTVASQSGLVNLNGKIRV